MAWKSLHGLSLRLSRCVSPFDFSPRNLYPHSIRLPSTLSPLLSSPKISFFTFTKTSTSSISITIYAQLLANRFLLLPPVARAIRKWLAPLSTRTMAARLYRLCASTTPHGRSILIPSLLAPCRRPSLSHTHTLAPLLSRTHIRAVVQLAGCRSIGFTLSLSSFSLSHTA